MPVWILPASTGLYVAALAVLLGVAKRSRKWYAFAKGVCSVLFVGTAVLAWLPGSRANPVHFSLLLAALLLCAFGDVLLGVANSSASRVQKKPFLAGAAFFSLAHCVLCALYATMVPFVWYDLLPPLALMGVVWALERKGLVRLKKIRPLGYLYTFFVGMMAWKAAFTAMPLVMAGAGMFLLSDVILLLLYFGTKRRGWYRVANLTTYYAGMYLLAWSAAQL